jgi:hypothetical protein
MMTPSDYWRHLLRLRDERRRVKRDLEQARRDAATTFLLMDGARGYVVQAGWVLN